MACRGWEARRLAPSFAWLELGASIIGFVPGGDIAKGIAKSTQKAITKTAVKVGTELADDAAKVVKGSTAAAADGLSSAQKTAGKVHAPRGPPGGAAAPDMPKRRGGENPATARGRQVHEEFKEKVKQKEGWKPEPRIEDTNGKQFRPDALTRNRNPIELKPNTPSGRAAGKRQIKKYEAVLGKKGRVIYYDP